MQESRNRCDMMVIYVEAYVPKAILSAQFIALLSRLSI